MTPLATCAGPKLTAELVALCEREEIHPGPEAGLPYFGEDEYRQVARDIMNEAGDEVWVFAYGSLLWRPAFEPRRSLKAQASGWRRDFCMEITRWRGSPSQPGLMMALRKGGHCRGMAMKLDPGASEDQLVGLLKREVDTGEDLEALHWIDAETDAGTVRALAFWAEPVSSRMFVERSLAEQALMLARACGSVGSGAAYLYNTVQSLRGLRLVDPYLEALSDSVASLIARDFGAGEALEALSAGRVEEKAARHVEIEPDRRSQFLAEAP